MSLYTRLVEDIATSSGGLCEDTLRQKLRSAADMYKNLRARGRGMVKSAVLAAKHGFKGGGAGSRGVARHQQRDAAERASRQARKKATKETRRMPRGMKMVFGRMRKVREAVEVFPALAEVREGDYVSTVDGVGGYVSSKDGKKIAIGVTNRPKSAGTVWTTTDKVSQG